MSRLNKFHFVIVLMLFLAGSSAPMWAQQSVVQTSSMPRWMVAAKQGKADAQYIMGNAYASGVPSLNIKKDPAAAFAWYLKAAKQNHINAQYEVAAAYIVGDGVSRDVPTARVWLKRAADAGHKDAIEVLAGFPAPQKVTEAASAPVAKQAATQRQRVISPPTPVSASGYEIAGVRIDPMEIVNTVITVDLFSGYWPWWLGGLALGFITISFWLAIKTTLGVSSSYDRILSWREDKDMAKAAAVMQETPGGVLESAMMAATMEQFGDDIPDELLIDEGGAATAVSPMPAASLRVPWPAHVTFLMATVAGGFLASFATGNFELRFDMGNTFERFFGGAMMWPVLLAGGLLIGFGTRMGGGCTSGHGLSGCSRLQPGSLLGTASFFGTAIAVSLLMEMFL